MPFIFLQVVSPFLPFFVFFFSFLLFYLLFFVFPSFVFVFYFGCCLKPFSCLLFFTFFVFFFFRRLRCLSSFCKWQVLSCFSLFFFFVFLCLRFYPFSSQSTKIFFFFSDFCLIFLDVLLRRDRNTIIDGSPLLSLNPKQIEVKRVPLTPVFVVKKSKKKESKKGKKKGK